MMLLYRWNTRTGAESRQEVAALPLASAGEVPEDEIWWIDLENSSDEEERTVLQGFLKVHPLTLKDVTKPRREPGRRPHFPKVEEFHDYLFVIANPLRPNVLDPKQMEGKHSRRFVFHLQLSAVMTRRVLITHHYQPLPSVQTVQQYVARHDECGGRGPAYLFQLILDAMVDEYAPVVDLLSDSLDIIETRMFRRPSPTTQAQLIRLKRSIVALRKTLVLEREILLRLTRGEFHLINEREIVYYRNVYDHLVRYTELIESARELVTDLMQSYLAAMSNRLNSIMKVLAMISTIVLPMSLIASIYGMNFRHGMVELDWEYGYAYALGLMGLTGVLALVVFWWRKWF
jgi:magnesium transporter